MSDERFTFLHARMDVVPLIAEEDFAFAMPNETTDVDVPTHLIPLYQDEEDDSILPTNSHPSYPYGNPYKPTAASKLSSPFPMAQRSLATSLSTFYQAQLGHPASTQRWTDMGLDGILPYEPPQEHVTMPSAIPDDPRPGGHAAHGPAGQRDEGGRAGAGTTAAATPAADPPVAEESGRSSTPGETP